MTHDIVLVAVMLALAHLELAVVAVFALRKVRKATHNPFSIAPVNKYTGLPLR